MSIGFIIFCLGITGLVITIICILISISKKGKREKDLSYSYSNSNLRNKNQFEDYNDETVSLLNDRIKEDKHKPNNNTIFTSKYNNSVVTLKKHEEKYQEPESFNQIAYEDDKTESLVDVVEVQNYFSENKVKPSFCTNCGLKNDEDYRFCTNCGYKRTT